MKWKIVVSLLLIVVLTGILITNENTPTYANIFKNGISGLASIIVKPSGIMNINLNVQKQAFYGQKFKISNSTLTSSATPISMKINGIDYMLKDISRTDINIGKMSGSFDITPVGSVVISARTRYVEIGEMILTQPKDMKVEMEIIPIEFSLTEIEKNKITLLSATGDMELPRNDTITTIPLENEKLEIRTFSGTLEMDKDIMRLNGRLGSVKGLSSGFSFSG